MSLIAKKADILFSALKGEMIKLRYRLIGYSMPATGINVEKRRDVPPIVVSLTSYGRRVPSLTPLTIVSLMRQSFKPDAIVLYLDYDNWNASNLPEKIKQLQRHGLTVKFVKDLKSFTKLVPEFLEPTLCEDEIVITADDDLFYHKDTVRQLIESWKKNPEAIHTHRAHRIRFDSDGRLMPYNDWDLEVCDTEGRLLFPTGVGGCAYSRRLFHGDVCRDDLFLKLCPKADDVWFFFMEWMRGTRIVVLPKRNRIITPLDAFYQLLHKTASLSASNCKQSGNDPQIQAVMLYYGITAAQLAASDEKTSIVPPCGL